MCARPNKVTVDYFSNHIVQFISNAKVRIASMALEWIARLSLGSSASYDYNSIHVIHRLEPGMGVPGTRVSVLSAVMTIYALVNSGDIGSI